MAQGEPDRAGAFRLTQYDSSGTAALTGRRGGGDTIG